MDKKQSLELCAALSNAKGAPGFEDEVLAVLRRYGEGLGSFREDSLRNLYLSRSGNQGGRPMVQLDAHTDEVACASPPWAAGFPPTSPPTGFGFRRPTETISPASPPASPPTL